MLDGRDGRDRLEPFSLAIGVGKTNAYAHGGEPGWMDACSKVKVTFFSSRQKVAPRFSRNRGLETEQIKHHLLLLSRLPDSLSKVDVVPHAATPRGYHGYPYGVSDEFPELEHRRLVATMVSVWKGRVVFLSWVTAGGSWPPPSTI